MATQDTKECDETVDEAVEGVNRYEFNLLHCLAEGLPDLDDPRYAPVKAAPPPGCSAGRYGDFFCLRCERQGQNLLDAVAPVCAEVRAASGVLMTDLGVEGLWEWKADGRDGHGATVVAQLLLMAAERASLIGYGVDDLVRFLRTAAG
ncbi:amidase [Streptomyces sp. NBC_01429]|uniref:amidase n=1 Tax=Streptomyces sp. NBC_01429 TaxID=2903862 RepID=UPI002E2843AA|nr:amidase [Streptomyces sp. NBC_01429]